MYSDYVDVVLWNTVKFICHVTSSHLYMNYSKCIIRMYQLENSKPVRWPVTFGPVINYSHCKMCLSVPCYSTNMHVIICGNVRSICDVSIFIPNIELLLKTNVLNRKDMLGEEICKLFCELHKYL